MILRNSVSGMGQIKWSMFDQKFFQVVVERHFENKWAAARVDSLVGPFVGLGPRTMITVVFASY